MKEWVWEREHHELFSSLKVNGLKTRNIKMTVFTFWFDSKKEQNSGSHVLNDIQIWHNPTWNLTLWNDSTRYEYAVEQL